MTFDHDTRNIGKTKLTNKGETKSSNRYATSKGFNFSTYSFFKPSIIEVTELKGICEGNNKVGNNA